MNINVWHWIPKNAVYITLIVIPIEWTIELFFFFNLKIKKKNENQKKKNKKKKKNNK